MVLRLVLSLLTASALMAAPALAEVIYPTGLRVGLEPPSAARLSTRFPGFEDADRKVAISVLDLPAAAYERLEAAALADTQQGLTDVKRESFPFESGIGFLVTAQGEQNGTKVHKWFLIAKAAAGPASDLATLITVEVPEAARNVYTDAVLRKMLASVTFRKAPIAEQLRLLPFELRELANFRVVRVIPGGAILTEGPNDSIGTQPYMIVGVGRGGPADASEGGRIARDLLRSAPLLDLNITSAESLRLGRTPAYEVRAMAKGPDGGALSVIQWVRFGSGGYLRIIGVSRVEAWDQMFPRFRAVRDGIESR